MGRFEADWLPSEASLAALADLSATWMHRVHARRPQTTIVTNMTRPAGPVVAFDSQRGKAGQHIL